MKSSSSSLRMFLLFVTGSYRYYWMVVALLLLGAGQQRGSLLFSARAYQIHPRQKRRILLPFSSQRLHAPFATTSLHPQREESQLRQAIDSDDDGDDNSDDDFHHEMSEDDEMMDFLRQFQNRQKELEDAEKQQYQNWKKAKCQSDVCLVLPDTWVRRIDVDYPLVVCGSASDDLFVAHIETTQILARTTTTTQQQQSPKEATTTEEEELPTSSILLNNSLLSSDRVEHTLHQLYGQYDGGGTIAVALHGTLLCEARRSGGVYVWRLDTANNSRPPQPPDNDDDDDDAQEKMMRQRPSPHTSSSSSSMQLVSQGFIPSLQDCIVTCLQLVDNYLFVGTDAGTVEAYTLDDDDATKLPLTLKTQPDLLWKLGGASTTSSSSCTVLSLQVNTDLGLAVVTTDAGTVELLSIEDDNIDEEEEEEERRRLVRKPVGSFMPPFDGTERRASNAFPTCATIVESGHFDKTSDDGNGGAGIQVDRPKSFSIACGGNDGSLFLQPLKTDVNGDIDIEKNRDPFAGQPRIHSLMPKHFARVSCMCSPAPGLLATGGLDGTLRLWDTDNKELLYQFVGYKVWLGSLWTDGKRLISDGADNTVIVHDFCDATASNNNSGGSGQSEDQKQDDKDM